MDKKIIKFDDTEIEEYKFRQHKSPISINNIYIYITKIVVSNKLPFSKQDFKYFIGYKDAKNIRPLCIFSSKVSIYRREFDKTKSMCFLLKDKNFLEKRIEIWEKVSNVIKKNVIVNLYLIKDI